MQIKVGEKQFKKIVWIFLTLIFIITIGLSTYIPSLGFDYDFEKFFPIADEETNYFFDHRKKFESDNDFLLIAIQNENGIFETDFLKKVNRLSNELQAKVPHLQFVSSITNQKEQLIFPGGGGTSKLYLDTVDVNLLRDSVRIYRSKELVNVLVSEDAKSLCLFLRHEDYISKKKSDKVLEVVEQITAKYDFEKVRIAGRVIGQKYYIDKMNYELLFFVGLSLFLIVLFLYISFRSGWGILLPQFVVVASMVWLLGLMGMFKQPINIILTTLPSIMFVVSMSDVIHLVSRYLDAIRTGMSKFEAIKLTVREVGFATFLTSLTTAIGFFTLYFVKVEPIQKFGLVIGFGVMIAFFLIITILPLLFYAFPTPKHIYKQRESHFWLKYLRKWFVYLINNKKRILIIYGLVTIVFTLGIFMIRTNNFIMDDLRASEPMKQDFNYLDEHYGGIRPFELSVELVDSTATFWSNDVLNDIEKVENYLENDYGVRIKNSLVQVVKVLNRSSHAGNPDYFDLPESKSKLKTIRRIVKIAGGGRLYRILVDSTETVTRISGTIPDMGNIAVSERNRKLLDFIKKSDFQSGVKFKLTGTAHLFDKNIRYLSTSLIQGLLASILIVALIMGLIYRSVTMMIISIIPNIFPLIIIGGIMGFFGIELKISTAIIFTIAFGIAVDDTIHLLGKFKFELMKGSSKIVALKRAYLTTGKAMILTTLILCSGFLLLVFSTFMGTFNMGVLLSITLFVALIADLSLLPILIILFYHPKRKKRVEELS
jgi:predicted RND superfamily exporter protein